MRGGLLACWLLATALVAAGPVALAEEPAEPTEPAPPVEAAAEPEEPPTKAERWLPPTPDPEAKDWLRLTSGEWVKGDLERLRDDVVEFDSEELDDLKIDWEDISELRSPRRHTYLMTDRVVHQGAAVMRDGKLLIQGADQVWEYPRDEVVGIVAGGVSELDYWHLRTGVGLGTRSGNTEEVDITGTFSFWREGALTRFALSYDGAISTVNSVLNTNTHRAGGSFDVYASRKVYWIVAKADVFSDQFQNVNVRVTPSSGIGYEVFDDSRFEWDLELSAGYQWTRFEDSDTEGTFTLIPSTSVDFDITKRLEFEGTYSAQLAIPDTSKSNQHATATLSFELTEILDLDLDFTWDRIEDPPPNNDGTVPEKNDYRLSVGLAIEFN